jgi:hypothetical protein
MEKNGDDVYLEEVLKSFNPDAEPSSTNNSST